MQSKEKLIAYIFPCAYIFICLQVVHAESRTCPFILFMKDAEKSVVGNSESYSAFKSKLERLPENVIVIGSQTHSDNWKEKVVTDNAFAPAAYIELSWQK